MQQEKPAAEVRLTNETIRHLEQKMVDAVENGIKRVLNQETAEIFWAAGFSVLQKNATQHAGRFVIGGLMGLFKKLGLFLTLGGIVYALGGWQALTNLFKVLFMSNGG